MTYDQWKSTDPRDAEPYFGTCPVCKSRHWEHESCEDAEFEPEQEDDSE